MDLCYALAANLTMADAVERLDRERVPFAMVLTPAQLIDDPHAVAIGLIEEHDHPVAGPVRMARHPILYGRTPAALAGAAPALGADTDDLLDSIGLADRIADYRQRGVVA